MFSLVHLFLPNYRFCPLEYLQNILKNSQKVITLDDCPNRKLPQIKEFSTEALMDGDYIPKFILV